MAAEYVIINTNKFGTGGENPLAQTVCLIKLEELIMPAEMKLDHPDYHSQKGMQEYMEEVARYFREELTGTIAERIPLYIHEVNYEKKTLTTVLTPTPWMADRTGGMSNGAFSVALDETMGFLGLYIANLPMTPTVTMQLSLLRPIPIDKKLYIKTRLMGTDGVKLDLTATAWSEGMKDSPACTAVGIYFAPKQKA